MEKSKSMVWRMLLILFFAFFFWGGGIGAYAAKKAWVKYANYTLTFQYGEKESLGRYEYWLNEGTAKPDWYSTRYNVVNVKFDSSFASARPTSCAYWFSEFAILNTIDGIEYLNTSNVTNMAYMFYKCPGLTSLDVSNFNTSNVMNMGAMFYGCSGLTVLDVSSFNTSKVKVMYGMFMGCSKIETILASDKFDVSNVTNSNLMFTNCTSLKGYDENKTDKTYATVNGGYFTNALRPWVKYVDGTLTFQCSYKKTLGTDEYWLNEGSNDPGWSSKSTSIKTVVFDKSFAQVLPTSCNSWFHNCSILSAIEGIENLNTSNVTNMYRMFSYCSRLISLDLSSFNTSNVTNMYRMFSYCSRLISLDLSNFNTSKVTNMTAMFADCSRLTSLGVSNFDTSNVTDMENMFRGCSGLTSLDLSNFNTSNVKSMYRMFCGCNGLSSLDLSNFNTSKVTRMTAMFEDCSGLTSLDVSNFDTSNVTYMADMFYGCSGLTSLDVSNFNTSSVTFMSSMFYGCSRLTSLNLSHFDTSNVTDVESMFASATSIKSIYFGDGFKVDKLESIVNDKTFDNCPATLYCSPKQYGSFKDNNVIASFGNAVKPYVNINQKSEYGTLCVPVGSSLAENSFTGFDKLYQVQNADKSKGTITMVEAKSIEPGVPYVYHRYLESVDFESKTEESSSETPSVAKAPVMSVITFDVDENASTSVTAPKNDGSLLKGTFESMVAIGGSYILQTDGNFHPVAADNTTLKVGAYHAYLDLNPTSDGDDGDLGEGGAEISAKGYRMVFEDGEATGIDRINGVGSDKGVCDQADHQPKVYFDLMGRKVNAPQKGEMYIVNGKKVMYNK